MLTKRNVIIAVRHVVAANTLEVHSVTEVLENGAVIGSNRTDRAYMPEEKVDFELDMGADAAKYLTLAGW